MYYDFMNMRKYQGTSFFRCFERKYISMNIELSVSFGMDPVPVEKRIEGMEPLCDGLYPHEVLVLSYVPHFTDKTKKYQLFWEYSYGIQDVSLIIASLFEKGFFRKGTIVETIKLSTVPILKELLKKRNLKVSGKKDDLIKRIIENIPEDELEPIFNERPYKLTTKGEEILRKYEWVPYLHRNFCGDVDMWDFAKLMEEPPITDYKEKLWVYLVRKGEVLLKENNYGFYRNTISKLYKLAFENGNFEKAFMLLCIITAYDLTYHSNGFEFDMFRVCLNHDLNYSYKPNSSRRVGKYWIEIFEKYQEKKELDKQLTLLKEKEESLKVDAKKLQNPDYIARYAREKYQYSKEGEFILQIPEE